MATDDPRLVLDEDSAGLFPLGSQLATLAPPVGSCASTLCTEGVALSEWRSVSFYGCLCCVARDKGPLRQAGVCQCAREANNTDAHVGDPPKLVHGCFCGRDRTLRCVLTQSRDALSFDDRWVGRANPRERGCNHSCFFAFDEGLPARGAARSLRRRSLMSPKSTHSVRRSQSAELPRSRARRHRRDQPG